MTKFLIVGSGAREHAIAKALIRSSSKPLIYCCGSSRNPGIEVLTTDYWQGDINDVDQVITLAKQWQIDIAIIGPEAPLENGLADVLWKNGIATIGPKKRLAQIETSKSFARNLLKRFQPDSLPEYKIFRDTFGVREFLEHLGSNQYVIKANGLMGGKGVKVGGEHLHSFAEALQFCEELYAEGHTFVIEEKLIGQEFSLLCFCDGIRLVPMPIVQDHKRAYVDDEGPNTGGMGSYSLPNHRLPFLSDTDIENAMKINQAAITALTYEFQESYIGILYGSFIATKSGVKLIEFNARFGDPEALNVLAILESDFAEICVSMVSTTLTHDMVSFANLATVCKYTVPDGYPDNPVKNIAVDVSGVQDTEHLYLGAVHAENNQLYATGSRTAAVVGVAETLAEAEKMAENEIRHIKGQLFHREDIGTKELINRRIQQMQELRQRDYRLL